MASKLLAEQLLMREAEANAESLALLSCSHNFYSNTLLSEITMCLLAAIYLFTFSSVSLSILLCN